MESRRNWTEFPLGIVPGFIPYMAVFAGMYVLHSAWTAMLLYHLGIVLAISLHRRWDLLATLIRGFRGSILSGLIPVYLSAGIIIYFFWPVAGLEHLQLADALASFGLQPTSLSIFVVYYCVVNSTLEELFWRGLLIDKSRLIGWSDLVFSGYHGLVMGLFVSWFWVGLSFVLLAVGALIWRTVARRLGGLALPWLTHLAADTGVMAAVYLLLMQ